jgi:hypothetical protein
MGGVWEFGMGCGAMQRARFLVLSTKKHGMDGDILSSWRGSVMASEYEMHRHA